MLLLGFSGVIVLLGEGLHALIFLLLDAASDNDDYGCEDQEAADRDDPPEPFKV